MHQLVEQAVVQLRLSAIAYCTDEHISHLHNISGHPGCSMIREKHQINELWEQHKSSTEQWSAAATQIRHDKQTSSHTMGQDCPTHQSYADAHHSALGYELLHPT
jgi:hypothetical protein